MEVSRSLLLGRQNARQWLDYLGVTDSSSLPFQRCFSLADICGGTGAISRWLLSAHDCISAIVSDSDANLLKIGRSLASANKIGERIRFQLADAYFIPMKKNSVDCCFIHGAIHLLKHGEQVLSEMIRICRKRVVIFCADMNYTAPLEKDETQSPFDDDISKLERDVFMIASRDYKFMTLPDTAVSQEKVPYFLKSSGCQDVFVRGVMEVVDFEELEPEDYIAYRRTETKELINRIKETDLSHERDIENLIKLYTRRQNFLIERHKRGERKYAWTGGPVVVWIGIKG